MGAYRSIFETSPEDKKTKLSPNKGDWITGHADLTGLAVVEVQRLWIRFSQLNCDSKGLLSKKQLERGELSRDIFIKNIIANLPKEKDGSLSFLVFLKFMQWVDTASVEQKLKLIFHFLNNGDDITEDVVEKLFRKIYTNSDEKELADLINLFMEQLDPDNTKKINEKNFIKNIFANYDREELNYLLKYDLIPNDVLRELNMRPSLPGSQLNMRNTNVPDTKSDLSDEILESVARKVIKRDWEELAISLGYTKREIQLYKSKYNEIDYDIILALMIDWRDQNSNSATKNRLRKYLEELRMNDAAVLLR